MASKIPFSFPYYLNQFSFIPSISTFSSDIHQFVVVHHDITVHDIYSREIIRIDEKNMSINPTSSIITIRPL